jgi:hypothetical protein
LPLTELVKALFTAEHSAMECLEAAIEERPNNLEQPRDEQPRDRRNVTGTIIHLSIAFLHAVIVPSVTGIYVTRIS